MGINLLNEQIPASLWPDKVEAGVGKGGRWRPSKEGCTSCHSRHRATFVCSLLSRPKYFTSVFLEYKQRNLRSVWPCPCRHVFRSLSLFVRAILLFLSNWTLATTRVRTLINRPVYVGVHMYIHIASPSNAPALNKEPLPLVLLNT